MFLLDREGAIAGRSQGFDKADLNQFAAELALLAGVEPPPPIPSDDGNPNFQPGCVSRHLEPQPDAPEGPRAALYDRHGSRAGRVEVPAGTDPEEFCYEQEFADPLPVLPPTVERVERAMASISLPPNEIVAHVPPNYGQATVEKIAANAVMAGCRPEYMRVLVPLVRALCDERAEHSRCARHDPLRGSAGGDQRAGSQRVAVRLRKQCVLERGPDEFDDRQGSPTALAKSRRCRTRPDRHVHDG